MRLRQSPLSLTSLEARLAPALINFTLNSATSTLTLSGSVDGNAIQAQQTGSLTAKYSGTIQVDVDFTNNLIQFVGAKTSAAALNFTSNLIPAVGGGTAFIPGSAPANYGGKANISGLNTNLAGRNMVASFDSPLLPLAGAGATRTFASTQTVTLTAGTVDYNNFLLQGTEPLVGQGGQNAGADGSITDNGNGNYTLVMPGNATINDTVNGLPLILNIAGTLNGTAVLPVVDLNGPGAGFDTMFTHPVGSAPTLIAPAGTVTRTPSANLTGMTVTLVAPPDGASEFLTADVTGTGLVNNGYNPLTGELSISGTGSLANYQSVLQKIAYGHASATPTTGPRTIEVTVTDGTNSSLVRSATGNVVAASPATVQQVQVNDGSVQRSLVTSLTVTFNSKINPDPTAAAFQLVRSSDSANVTLSLNVDNSGPTTKAVLTFTGGAVNGTSLADGRYNLTINGGLINGGNFDGGSGVGSNYQLIGDPAAEPKLFRLFGDADGNNLVSATDFNAFRLVYGTSGMSIFDFDNSGSVTAVDFNEFRLRYGASV